MRKNKLTLDFGTRPKCINDDCENSGQFMGSYKKDGTPRFRKYCASCHGTRTANKRGLKSMAEVIAVNAGFDTSAEYLNSTHPYRKYRKTYCENVDSRLGFRCTTTILLSAQLEVDHIDGNPANNDPDNLQTLCACCHKYKTITEEDYKSPGRKELGIKY